MYIVLTVKRSPNLHHIFFQTAKQHRTIKTFQFPPLTYLKIKLQQCGFAFSGKKNNERKTESVNGMFKENNTSLNNNGNRKNRHATYNLDCNVTFKERYNEIFSFSC